MAQGILFTFSKEYLPLSHQQLTHLMPKPHRGYLTGWQPSSISKVTPVQFLPGARFPDEGFTCNNRRNKRNFIKKSCTFAVNEEWGIFSDWNILCLQIVFSYNLIVKQERHIKLAKEQPTRIAHHGLLIFDETRIS